MLLEGKGAAYIQDRGVSRWGKYFVFCIHPSRCLLSSFLPRLISTTIYLYKLITLHFYGEQCYVATKLTDDVDTCGAQAILEANGGVLAKLTKFTNMTRTDAHSVFAFATATAAAAAAPVGGPTCAGLESYNYLKSEANLDFEEGAANLTPYNAVVPVAKGAAPSKGTHADFQPYSTICGLLALNAQGLQTLPQLYEQIQAVKETAPPAYD